jgi:hypothetical protein
MVRYLVLCLCSTVPQKVRVKSIQFVQHAYLVFQVKRILQAISQLVPPKIPGENGSKRIKKGKKSLRRADVPPCVCQNQSYSVM